MIQGFGIVLSKRGGFFARFNYSWICAVKSYICIIYIIKVIRSTLRGNAFENPIFVPCQFSFFQKITYNRIKSLHHVRSSMKHNDQMLVTHW